MKKKITKSQRAAWVVFSSFIIFIVMLFVVSYAVAHVPSWAKVATIITGIIFLFGNGVFLIAGWTTFSNLDEEEKEKQPVRE